MFYTKIFLNKIIIRFEKLLIVVIVFLCTQCTAYGQDTVLNKYGLWVINNRDDLQKTVLHNPKKQMIDLKKHIPNLVLDLKYASKANFMKTQLYSPLKTTYLRKEAADALKKVQQELNKQGLGLKIFDAYRPYSVTEKMWEPVQDDRYAANPKKGSGHNRGVAVDLTIINLKTKKELNMGTGFDNFSDTAHTDFINLPQVILQNRALLKTTMEKYSFKVLDTEWWHFYLPHAKEYELLDVPFAEFEKQKRKKKKK
ncbi:MAG: M15 family metallopeptidase [Chitinophagaceae bacterium]|nr:M15 family metallopeptidase [Chitinophagaceae bacterium]